MTPQLHQQQQQQMIAHAQAMQARAQQGLTPAQHSFGAPGQPQGPGQQPGQGPQQGQGQAQGPGPGPQTPQPLQPSQQQLQSQQLNPQQPGGPTSGMSREQLQVMQQNQMQVAANQMYSSLGLGQVNPQIMHHSAQTLGLAGRDVGAMSDEDRVSGVL